MDKGGAADTEKTVLALKRREEDEKEGRGNTVRVVVRKGDGGREVRGEGGRGERSGGVRGQEERGKGGGREDEDMTQDTGEGGSVG